MRRRRVPSDPRHRRHSHDGGGYLPKGGVGTPHTHVHEQVSYVAKGSFDFTLDGITRRLRVGDSVYIPSGAMHGTVALEDSVIVDVFTPIREDFLSGK